MNRRDFTQVAGLGMLAMQILPKSASAIRLFNKPSGNTKIPLGLCEHSLRSLDLNAKQLIEYAIKQKLDAVLFNTLRSFESLEAEHLSELKQMAKAKGVRIYIGVGSISESSKHFSYKHGNANELLREGIRVASLVDSPLVGCRIGSYEDRYMEGGIEAHIERVVQVMRSLRQQALDAGIKFAFENHVGDLRSNELLGIIDETGTDICGALFDPANALWAMEDPMEAFMNLGSTVICTSVRDVQIWETKEGATFQGMAIGEGLIDYPLFSEKMAELCPGVPFQVETISNSARSIPFLNPGFWRGYPNIPASGIASFLRLVRSGTQQKIVKPPDGKSKKEFNIELQQSELQKSFDYLRKNCHAGLKS